MMNVKRHAKAAYSGGDVGNQVYRRKCEPYIYVVVQGRPHLTLNRVLRSVESWVNVDILAHVWSAVFKRAKRNGLGILQVYFRSAVRSISSCPYYVYQTVVTERCGLSLCPRGVK